MRLSWLLVAVALAGCADPVAQPHYSLTGTYSMAAKPEQIAQLREELELQGLSVEPVVGSPHQFQLQDLSRQECDAARPLLLSKAYVARVDECRPRLSPPAAKAGP